MATLGVKFERSGLTFTPADFEDLLAPPTSIMANKALKARLSEKGNAMRTRSLPQLLQKSPTVSTSSSDRSSGSGTLQRKVHHGSLMDLTSCGHCLERLPYMVDPRKLPCGHIFCFSCLQTEYRKHGEIKCETCGKVHENLDLDRVTRVQRLTKQTTRSGESETRSVPCDVCKKDAENAVTFCVDCGKKMCQKHLEFHDGYQMDFSKHEHKKISIDIYLKAPNKFEVCDRPGHRDQILKKACRHCHKLFCDKCDTKVICDKHSTKQHDVRTLEDLASECKEQLNMKMRNVSGKITEVIRLQKNTSGDVADIEEKAHYMNAEVDKVTEGQIAEIRRKAEALKSEINVYLHQSVSQAEMFSNSLMIKKDLLDELWKSSQNLVAHSRDAEIVRQYRDKREELDTGVKIDTGYCQLSRKMLSTKGECRDVELQFHESTPSALRYRVREKNVMVHCSSVAWTEDEMLLCGRDSYMEVRNSDNMNVLKNLKASNANGVALHKQGYVALHWANGKNYIILYSADLVFLKLFGEFFRTTDKFSHLTSSDKHVVAVDPDHKMLKVYSTNGENLYDTKLMGIMRPWGVHCTQDGSVLVTDFMAGTIKKYKIKEGDSEALWVCRDLESPTGVSSDYTGLIYVASFSGKKIYVLSHDGLKLETLTNKKLQAVKEVYDIDVLDDHIALACGEEGIICCQMSFDAVVL